MNFIKRQLQKKPIEYSIGFLIKRYQNRFRIVNFIKTCVFLKKLILKGQDLELQLKRALEL
jgi:hypothetical protein